LTRSSTKQFCAPNSVLFARWQHMFVRQASVADTEFTATEARLGENERSRLIVNAAYIKLH